MAQLTAGTERTYTVGDHRDTSQPVEASAVIYKGAALGDDASGFVRQFVDGDPFRGFALENVTGGATDGAERCAVRYRGIIQLTVTGGAANKVNASVYLTDSNTFSLTDSGSDKVVGLIHTHVSGTTVNVRFDVNSPAAAAVSA
jgi:hypothetical protein